MAGTTRPGPHGTTMKPYGSFAGKAAESGAAVPIMMLQMNQYSGGMTSKGVKR